MSQSKAEIIHSILKSLNEDLDVTRRAALETHQNSTDSQSKQEGKYDTRGLEASYLAEAQAAKVATLKEQIGVIERLELRIDDGSPVAPGAMCIVSTELDEFGYIMLPTGGGIQRDYHGMVFTVITPDSPIGDSLLGNEVGEQITLPNGNTAFIDDIW